MSNTDVGDDGGIRRCDLRQRRDFAGMIHPDFPDRDFVVGRRFQNSAGQSNMVIEVALCFGDAKFPTEDRGRKILCACLSIAAGDGENFDRKRSPIIGGQILIGEQSVLRANDRERGWNFSVPLKIDNRSGRPGLSGRFHEFVAVEIFTSQGNEKFTLLNSS